MRNILFIQMNELYVEFVLGVVIQSQDQVDSLIPLYTHKWEGFGFKTMVAEMAKTLINTENDDLLHILTLYYESLLVGRHFDLTSVADNELVSRVDKLLTQAKESIKKSSDEELDDFFSSSGLSSKFEGVLKRIHKDILKYPIDAIVIVGSDHNDRWLNKCILNIFSDKFIDHKTALPAIRNDFENVQSSKQLLLKYQNKEYPILELSDYPDAIQENSIEFQIQFSLDTHIHLSIFERWREMGIPKERKVVNYSFNLPFFYTGDIIQLKVRLQSDKNYSFQVIHKDTGQSCSF